MEKTVPAKQEKALLPMICEGASSSQIVRQFGTLTLNKVLQSNYKTLARLKKEQGEERAEKALAVLIADSALAFGEELTPNQAMYFATEIISVYYYFSLEDCFVVLQQLKKNKLYGKLCLNTYLTAFEQYATERFKAAEEQSYNKHLSYKELNPKLYENVFDIKNTDKPKQPKRIGAFLKR